MRTHAVLVIGLHELLGNPTTQLIEPPGTPLLIEQPGRLNRVTYNHISYQVDDWYKHILLV